MNKKKQPLILLVVLITLLVLLSNIGLINVVKSQDSIDFGIYYSNNLGSGSVLEWKFNRFNISGFEDEILQEFPLQEGSNIELRILKSLKSYNLIQDMNKEDSEIVDPNEYFSMNIDGKHFEIPKFNQIMYYFDTEFTYTENHNDGSLEQITTVIFDALVFLIPNHEKYDNGTIVNRFEQENSAVENENFTITDDQRNLQIEKSTGIVLKYIINYELNFSDNQNFMVDINYELITRDIKNSANELINNLIILSISGTGGLIIGVIIARTLRKRRLRKIK